MTSWTRILQSPAARRTSSYFSSKAGGGRYFNSAKPVTAPTAPKKSSSIERADSSSNQTFKVAEAENDASPSRITRPAVVEFAPHPIIGDKELKLHQFFSLHRPLLLLSNPPSILHSSPPATTFTEPSLPTLRTSMETSPEIAAANDAEAGRTITRALAINCAGATSMWEETLKRIGLDVALEPERVGLQERLDKELQEVRMDSTKRKRRKKMKKHK